MRPRVPEFTKDLSGRRNGDGGQRHWGGLPGGVCSGGGFTLIELIIVVAIMAFVYTVALPQIGLKTGTESASKVNQLATGIRSAYDLAVLSGKPHRIVFELVSGNYWLERTNQEQFYLGDRRVGRDPTERDVEDRRAAFEMDFQEYKDMAGRAVYDAENEEEIPPTSPVLQARDELRGPSWTKVSTMEWGDRSLGPNLMIQDMQAEHHGQVQDFRDLGPEARGMLYFFPHGYVERAVIHVVYKAGEMEVDQEEKPYTITTNPWEGTATVEVGYKEVDVHEPLDSF